MASAILQLVTANPAYPAAPGAPAEFSTITQEVVLADDPQFQINDKTLVEMGPSSALNFLALNFEVREKKFSVNITNNPLNTATVIYSLSAFGVTQPDGSVYGN